MFIKLISFADMGTGSEKSSVDGGGGDVASSVSELRPISSSSDDRSSSDAIVGRVETVDPGGLLLVSLPSFTS